MPSFEAITPIPASMDMEIVRVRLGCLVRKEEAFDGREVGVSRREEDKFVLWSEDGKERDAIVIAIGMSELYREEKRREEDRTLFLSSSSSRIYLYTPK